MTSFLQIIKWYLKLFYIIKIKKLLVGIIDEYLGNGLLICGVILAGWDRVVGLSTRKFGLGL